MNTIRVKALFKREITDVLRDKKTLIMMVGVPMLLYPLVIVVMSLFMSGLVGTGGGTVYRVAFVDMAEESAKAMEEILKEKNEDTSFAFSVLDSQSAPDELDGERIHAFVKETAENHFVVHYLSAQNNSEKTQRMVMDALEVYLEDSRIEQVEMRGLNRQEILEPISFAREDLSSSEESMGNVIGNAMPVMMIISIVLGVIYPAIDVTAGEKERGTLETLITMPVTNFEMIMSKFLAVSVVACVSAFLNILCMGGAFGFMGSLMSEQMGGAGIHLVSFLPAILMTVVVMIFFALFVTAVCLFVCLFAKSFKEANNYATPVMLVFMLAAYMGMMPELQLTAVTAGIPIINIALLVKQLFQMNYEYPLFGIVLVSNAAYSFLMMWLLAKVYRSEGVLFGEGFSGVQLFEKRSDMKKGQMPGYGDIVLLVCGIFLLSFYVGGAVQSKLALGGVAITQAIVLVLPAVYAWYLKSDWKRLLSVKMPKIGHLAGTLVLWAGALCMVQVVTFLLAPLMPESLEAVETAFDFLINNQSVLVLWLVMALMPAVGEELLFRGFIFGTLREKGNLLTAMLITSGIFGLFHMSLIKFFTTFILGFLIVTAVQKSGSIFAGMLFHLVNNTYGVMAMKYPEMLDQIPLLTVKEPTLLQGMILLAAGMVGIGAGIFLMGKSEKHSREFRPGTR